MTDAPSTRAASSLAPPSLKERFLSLDFFRGQILTSLAAWAVLWSMCYWLYRKKIIIKI